MLLGRFVMIRTMSLFVQFPFIQKTLATDTVAPFIFLEVDLTLVMNLLQYGLDRSLVIRVCGSCLLYTSPSPRDATLSRMPSSA